MANVEFVGQYADVPDYLYNLSFTVPEKDEFDSSNDKTKKQFNWLIPIVIGSAAFITGILIKKTRRRRRYR